MGELGTRASQQRTLAGSTVTIANEPLVVTLVPSPIQGTHWVVNSLTAMALSTAAGQPVLQPESGLFLVPANELPETLADAQTGINLASRGVPLPCDINVLALGAGSLTYKFAVSITLKSTQNSLIVTPGYTLRLIVNVAPGTAAPGPGANSVGKLTAIVVTEGNQ